MKLGQTISFSVPYLALGWSSLRRTFCAYGGCSKKHLSCQRNSRFRSRNRWSLTQEEEIVKPVVSLVGIFIAITAISAIAATPPLGTWEWSTTEESAGVVTTPGDLGYTIQREFGADATYREYRNEELFRTGHYWVEDVEFMDMIIPALYIDCGDPSPEVCAFYCGTSILELWWGADSVGWPSYPREVLEITTPVTSESYSWGGIKGLYR